MNEEITRLDTAVSLFSKTATIEDIGILAASTVRMPIIAHCTCKAIAQYSGQTLNRVLVELIEVGLEEVLLNLPTEDKEAILAIRSPLLHEALKTEHQNGSCD